MNYEDDYLLNYSEEVTVGALEEVVTNLSLTKLEEESGGGITGTIVNASSVAVADATVKVFDLNYNPIKHTMTNENGQYTITDLPSGDYLVYAIKEGYGLSTKRQITITDYTLNLTDIAIVLNEDLGKGTLYGITYNTSKVPVSKIKVTLSTIDDIPLVVAKTYSTTDGEYVFYNLDVGTYTVNAFSDDYILNETFVVEIEDGINNKELLYLEKLSQTKEGTINGTVLDESTEVPLEGCFVGLYLIDESGDETLDTITVTNKDGRYFFGYVPEGNYVIKAKMSS